MADKKFLVNVTVRLSTNKSHEFEQRKPYGQWQNTYLFNKDSRKQKCALMLAFGTE